MLPTPPTGWLNPANHASEYHNVYGKSCRTCHIARDAGNPNTFFVFNSFGNFQGTSFAVCGSGSPKRRYMPNAFVTYRNFWAELAEGAGLRGNRQHGTRQLRRLTAGSQAPEGRL